VIESQWVGYCFLLDADGNTIYRVDLAQAAPSTRIITPRPAHPAVVNPDPEMGEFDTWLLVGSPVRVPLEHHWSAIYQLEMESV